SQKTLLRKNGSATFSVLFCARLLGIEPVDLFRLASDVGHACPGRRARLVLETILAQLAVELLATLYALFQTWRGAAGVPLPRAPTPADRASLDRAVPRAPAFPAHPPPR